MEISEKSGTKESQKKVWGGGREGGGDALVRL